MEVWKFALQGRCFARHKQNLKKIVKTSKKETMHSCYIYKHYAKQRQVSCAEKLCTVPQNETHFTNRNGWPIKARNKTQTQTEHFITLLPHGMTTNYLQNWTKKLHQQFRLYKITNHHACRQFSGWNRNRVAHQLIKNKLAWKTANFLTSTWHMCCGHTKWFETMDNSWTSCLKKSSANTLMLGIELSTHTLCRMKSVSSLC